MAKTIKYYPSRVKDEMRRYGKSYVQKKYGMNVYNKVILGKAPSTIKSKSGKNLQHVAHPTQKTHVYATKGINHSLHSHMIGADKHVAGKGGKGNKGYNSLRNGRSDKSKLNAPPKARDGWNGPGVLSAFVEGGMADLAQGTGFKRQMNFNLSNDEDRAQGSEHDWAMPTSISHLISGQLRAAANQPADYWEAWAQDKGGTTTLSNRNGSPFGIDVNWQGDPNDTMMHSPDDGHDHGGEESQAMSAATKLAQSNPMGAFGTSNVMYDLGESPEYDEPDQHSVEDGDFGGWHSGSAYSSDGNRYDPYAQMDRNTWMSRYGSTEYVTLSEKDQAEWMKKDPAGFKKALKAASDAQNKAMSEYHKNFPNSTSVLKDSQAVKAYNTALQSSYAQFYNKNAGEGKPKMKADGSGLDIQNEPTGPGTDGEPYKQTPLPNYNTGEGGDAFNLPDEFTPTSDVYNPWAYGQGGEYNMMGPSPQVMAQATMEAMNLANAYFAPQRAALAYELGDMETDMRRLSANLGRQQDDPVLQAKLYKDASKAVRTLDIQQNTYAFQLADARRKEELQNWQFYDQMAQQEHQLRLQNYQFMKGLDLNYSQYNLQNWQAQYMANQGLPGQTTPPTGGSGGTEAPQASEDYNYGSARSVKPSTGQGNTLYAKRYY